MSGPAKDGGAPFRSAEAAYQEFLARRARGEPLDFEAFVAGHRELEQALRFLHEEAASREPAEDPDVVSQRVERLLCEAGELFSEKGRQRSPGNASGKPGAEHAERNLRSEVLEASGARYKVLRRIGSGGMGTVFEVMDLRLGRRLALKAVLTADSPPAGRGGLVPQAGLAERRRRLLREAWILARLQHPGLLPVLDIGATPDGGAFYTMPLVEGTDLAGVIRRARRGDREWPLARCVEVLLKAAETLAYAHSQGVIHRDLKPANIRVGRFGAVYIMDWGLAKDLKRRKGERTPVPEARGNPLSGVRPDADSSAQEEEKAGRDTEAGAVLGTYGYMAPEQEQGLGAGIDNRADIYSLGAILYETLTGVTPARAADLGRSRNPTDRRLANPPPPAVLNRHAPAELSAIACKAVSCDPEARYGSMSELADDLRAYLECRRVSAYRCGLSGPLRLWIRRNPARAVLSALVLLTVLGGLAAVGLSERSARDRLEAANRRVDAALAEAVRARQEAEAARDAERAAREEVMRLADMQLLTDLERRFRRLRLLALEHPEEFPKFFEDAEAVLGRRRLHRETLFRLGRAAQSPPANGPAAEDPHGGPAVRPFNALLQATRLQLASVEEELRTAAKVLEKAQQRGDRLLQALLEARCGTLLERRSRLQAKIEGIRNRQAQYALTPPGAREALWHFNSLLLLLARMELFRAEEPQRGILPLADAAYRAWRKSMIERAEDWKRAIRAIADRGISPAYRGLRIEPQPGLVPLGPDPQSGLWEFAHLQSGEPPARDGTGRLEFGPDCGIVFVLLPPEPPDAEPALVSKYEVTQGQWFRLTGENPSRFGPGAVIGGRKIDGRHPVESVTCVEAEEVFARYGLALPSLGLLKRISGSPTREGNFLDRSWCRLSGDSDSSAADDGAVLHAPAGSYPAGRFGLHDVWGNVAELACAETQEAGEIATAAGVLEDLDTCYACGGSFAKVAPGGGGADYWRVPRGARAADVGVRAVYPIRTLRGEEDDDAR